jgi:hypothetical protein
MLGVYLVTMAWRVLRLQMEEMTSRYGGWLRILNKQSQTTKKGWSSSLGVRRGANNSSLKKLAC